MKLSSAAARRAEFMAMVKRVGTPSTTVLASGKPYAKKRRMSTPNILAPAWKVDGNVLEVTLPLRLVSVMNAREFWREKAARTKEHRETACRLMHWAEEMANAYNGKRFPFTEEPSPTLVTITRIAPRLLDGDNLQGAAKAARDGIADWLGMDDRDPRVEWKYEQEKVAKTCGVRIRIEGKGSKQC